MGRVRLGEAFVVFAALWLWIVGSELEANTVGRMEAGQAAVLLGGTGYLPENLLLARVDGTQVFFEVGRIAQSGQRAGRGDRDRQDGLRGS